jgi:hypothetical protein
LFNKSFCREAFKRIFKEFTQSYLDRLVYAALGVSAGTAETPHTETVFGIARREGRISSLDNGEFTPYRKKG